jgi:hypothetical protein
MSSGHSGRRQLQATHASGSGGRGHSAQRRRGSCHWCTRAAAAEQTPGARVTCARTRGARSRSGGGGRWFSG